ncbi:MAG: ABC-type transport auxiliary lipoprotein family protein [Pseudomonadota bacterium]
MRLALPAMVALALLLEACAVSSPTINHLQLVALSEGKPASDSPRLFLDRVLLPDYLLRDELISREDEFTLQYDAQLRWAEPLDLGIQRVLAEELALLLDTRQITRYPSPAGNLVEWQLRVEIDRFERSGNTVQLRGRGYWSPGQDSSVTAATLDFDESVVPDSTDPGATARALSELLARFAVALADLKP